MDVNFNKKSFNKFILEWNPIEEKYFPKGKRDSNIDKNGKLKVEILNRFYFDTNQSISKEKLFNIYRTVSQLYFQDVAAEYQKIIEDVFNKFIYLTVNIDGIDMLFDSSYFDIEWQMHYNYDFNKHSSMYYRDHYIHQVRNMYEMFMFLKRFGFESYCEEWFEKKHTNFVCDYVQKAVEYDLKNMFEKDKNLYKKIVEQREDFQKGQYDEYILKQLLHELIYSVIIVSSLVHDIGYPLSFLLKEDRSISSFLPNAMKFINSIDNVSYLDSKLNDSLLYKLISKEEIEERIKKYDHGVLSAIILLLYYYDNGKIYSFKKVDRAIIELSALIIYNHTIKYKSHENSRNKKYHYINNVFTKNPLSYLFRICDDIQEWERVYFENTEMSNYLICEKCHTPIISINDRKNADDKIKYQCTCNENIISNLRKNRYRKTINVNSCKEVILKSDDRLVLNGIPQDKELIFYYDLFNLLEIARYNPTFAKYRANEIKKIKKALDNQNDFGFMYIDFFMSSNPVEIKLEILFQFVKKKDIKNYNDLLKCISVNIKNKDIKCRFEIYFEIIKIIMKYEKEESLNINYRKRQKDKIMNIISQIDNIYFRKLLDKAIDGFFDRCDCNKTNINPNLRMQKQINKNQIVSLKNTYMNLYQSTAEEINDGCYYMDTYEYKEYIKNNCEKDNWNFYLDLECFYELNILIK